MRKVFCDKCGVEITDSMKFDLSVNVELGAGRTYRTAELKGDLCSDCAKVLVKSLNDMFKEYSTAKKSGALINP